MSLADEFLELQRRVTKAQNARARAEGAREAAQAAYDEALAELAREYNVTTVEAATALLDSLRQELEAIVKTLTACLDEVGV